MPTCVVLQPSYIPWRGYFHLIEKSDVFVFYDDVQYDKHGWRNRNRVKTANGSVWLTVPVLARGNVTEHLAIRDVRIAADPRWRDKHLATLAQSYRRAPHFARYEPVLREIYGRGHALLADLTIDLTVALASELGLERRFVRSSALDVQGDRVSRLIDVIRATGCDHYVSGPSARSYLDETRTAAAGIRVEWMEYSYPEYPQLHGAFDGQVSILDTLFMLGPDAGSVIWGGDGPRRPPVS